jgi:hypothetical protein
MSANRGSNAPMVSVSIFDTTGLFGVQQKALIAKDDLLELTRANQVRKVGRQIADGSICLVMIVEGDLDRLQYGRHGSEHVRQR